MFFVRMKKLLARRRFENTEALLRQLHAMMLMALTKAGVSDPTRKRRQPSRIQLLYPELRHRSSYTYQIGQTSTLTELFLFAPLNSSDIRSEGELMVLT
jgi:hypothetical protein